MRADAALALVGVLWAGQGAASLAEDWAGAAARCVDAVVAGQADWPDGATVSGAMVTQYDKVTARDGTQARFCEVRSRRALGIGEVAAVTGAYAGLSAEWRNRGFEMRSPRSIRRSGAGLVSEMRSTRANPRGCVVALGFVSQPETGLVLFSASEIARQPCGAKPVEGGGE